MMILIIWSMKKEKHQFWTKTMEHARESLELLDHMVYVSWLADGRILTFRIVFLSFLSALVDNSSLLKSSTRD